MAQSISLSGLSSVNVGSSITITATGEFGSAYNSYRLYARTANSKATVSPTYRTGYEAKDDFTTTFSVTGSATGSETLYVYIQGSNDGVSWTNATYKTKSITVSAGKSNQAWTLSAGSVYIGSTLSVSSLISGTTYGTLSYSSSNTNKFTVSSSGTITGVAAGSATLTVTAAGNSSYNSRTQTCTITVSLAPKINQTWTLSNGTVQKGSTLSASTLISGTTYGTVSYSSSNSSVFTVNSSGTITGAGSGSATLTVTAAGNSSYNSRTQTCTITCTLPSPGWSLSPSTVRGWTSDTLTSTISSYSSYSSLTWSVTGYSLTSASRSGSTVSMTKTSAGYGYASVSTSANSNYAAKTAYAYGYFYTKPGTKSGLHYTGSAQQLLSSDAAYSSSTTFYYAVNQSTTPPTSGWSAGYTSATATNAGTYYVHVSTYSSSSSSYYIGYVTVTISMQSAEWVNLPGSVSATYTGSAINLAYAGEASGGTIYYRAKPSSLHSYTSWSTTIPTGTAAGTYNVQAYIAGDSTHSDSDVTSFDSTISKKTVSVNLPNTTEQSLDWTGSAQSPTYTASGTGFTTSGTTSATNRGEYTITYTLNTDNNITYKWSDNTTAAKTKTWYIVKAVNNITVTSPFSQVWYSSGAYNPTVLVIPAGTTMQITATAKFGTISYASSDTSVATVSSGGLITAGNDAGSATITLSVTGTGDYYGVSGTISLEVQNQSKTRVYYSNGWKVADPYVYYNGAWRRAVAYVYTSSGWKKA